MFSLKLNLNELKYLTFLNNLLLLFLINYYLQYYFFCRENVTKQVDTVQADLENLLKGLNEKYTFDANTFLNVSIYLFLLN